MFGRTKLLPHQRLAVAVFHDLRIAHAMAPPNLSGRQTGGLIMATVMITIAGTATFVVVRALTGAGSLVRTETLMRTAPPHLSIARAVRRARLMVRAGSGMAPDIDPAVARPRARHWREWGR